MRLYTPKKDAVKVLYKAAGQLLDDAADSVFSINRELNRTRAEACLSLAEKIAGFEAIKITCDRATSLEVERIPFDVGFTVETKESDGKIIIHTEVLRDDYRQDVLDAIIKRLVETLAIEVEDAALAANDLAENVPEIAAWLPPDPELEVTGE